MAKRYEIILGAQGITRLVIEEKSVAFFLTCVSSTDSLTSTKHNYFVCT